MVIKIVQFLASLSLLVLVHEFGHFIFAKIFKCRVEKFYIFFNPWFSLFKIRIGETIFGVGWVPLGGYCKISGMIDESMDTDQMKEPPKPYEFRSKPAWQRLLIMVGGVLMNVILAICIYIGLSISYGDAYYATKDVNAAYGFEFNQTAQEIGFRNGDKILNVNGQEIESSHEIPLALLLDGAQYVEIERDGEVLRIPMKEEYISRMLNDKIFASALIPFIVDQVETGSAADAAGLLPGDRLLSIDGKNITFSTRPIPEYAGQQTTLQIARDSAGIPQVLSLSVAVPAEGVLGLLAQDPSKFIPISTKTYNFFSAIPAGLKRAKTEIGNYFKQLKLIFSPKTEAYKSVGGFIAIGKIFPDSWSWFTFWNITAMLSIMLAVLNLLPIPGLDGGHIMFVLYEMITRRKPSDKFMEYAQMIGLFLLLGLIVYANGNDLVKLFN